MWRPWEAKTQFQESLGGGKAWLEAGSARANREDNFFPVPSRVIAFAAVAFIAAGVWDLSTLRADTGEMLEPSDYTPGIQTIADGLVMLGLAQALRLLLVLVTNTAKPF